MNTDKKNLKPKGIEKLTKQTNKEPTTEMFVKRQPFLPGPEWPQANKRNNGTLTLLVLWGPLCPATVSHFINLAMSLTVLDIFTKNCFSSDNVTQAKNKKQNQKANNSPTGSHCLQHW